jgi:hypothetical protein
MHSPNKPDSNWIQVGDALSPLLQKIAARMRQAQALETRPGAAGREATSGGGVRSRRTAGDDGAA